MRKFLANIFPLNKALLILLGSNATVLVSVAMLAPIWAIFVEKIGGGILESGLATSVFAVTAGIVVILTGKISDEVKHDELIVALGYLIIGVGFLMYLFVNSVWFLAVVQIVIGVGFAIYEPAFDSVYSKHLQKHAAGREWGAWEGINYFSHAIGAALGAVIAASLGFNALFVFMAALCFGSAIYIYFLPRRVL